MQKGWWEWETGIGAHCQQNQFQAYRVTLKGQFQKQAHANQL